MLFCLVVDKSKYLVGKLHFREQHLLQAIKSAMSSIISSDAKTISTITNVTEWQSWKHVICIHCLAYGIEKLVCILFFCSDKQGFRVLKHVKINQPLVQQHWTHLCWNDLSQYAPRNMFAFFKVTRLLVPCNQQSLSSLPLPTDGPPVSNRNVNP